MSGLNFWEKDIERPKSDKLSVNFAVQTIQNRPDGSGMASFGSVVLSAVVLWFGSLVIYGSWLAIRTDSGTMRDDEAINRSLLIKK